MIIVNVKCFNAGNVTQAKLVFKYIFRHIRNEYPSNVYI